MKTYTADVRWDGENWLASVRDLPGAHTYAKTVEVLRSRLREVVVLMADLPDEALDDPDVFHVSLAYTMEVHESLGGNSTVQAGAPMFGEFAKIVEERQEAKDEYDRLAEELAAKTRAAVAAARDMGISLRDTAQILELSHQRIGQIENEMTATSRTKVGRRVTTGAKDTKVSMKSGRFVAPKAASGSISRQDDKKKV